MSSNNFMGDDDELIRKINKRLDASSDDFMRDNDELIRKTNKKLESSPFAKNIKVPKPIVPPESVLEEFLNKGPDVTSNKSSKTAPTITASGSSKTGSELVPGALNQVVHVSNNDALWRARQIKAYICKHLTIHQVKERTVPQYELDEAEELKSIRRMRDQWNGSWDGIVEIMNEKRTKRGEPATWTKAAVYSSYILSAPRVFPKYGDVWFDPKQYMYLRDPMRHPAANLPGALNKPSNFIYGSGGSHKRVRTDDTAGKDLEGNVREFCAEASKQQELLKNVYITENLMKAVAEVEKHFWGHVANVMHTQSGRFFAADQLEKRFHEI